MGFLLSVGKFFLFLNLLLITGVATSDDDDGFIFTAPKRFLSGYEENLCITFQNGNQTGEVKAAILEQKEDNEIASALVKITEEDYGSKCFKISLPRTKITKGRLHLTIRFNPEEDLKINYIEQISIQTNPDVTFIQTDKPIYNGGHVVKFKVFTVRSDLTPVLEPADKIWIENPNGIHLAQWLNESTHNGFINKTFQLSDEPLTGKWFIRVRRNGDEVSQSFVVENYVLPKFSVTIRTPENITNTANITICARYLFGKPVHGNVLLQYFIKCSFSYYCHENGSSVTQRLRLGPNGCVGHGITLRNPTTFAQSLIVNATVLEDGTRTKGSASVGIRVNNFRRRGQPEFSPRTKNKKFKPGLPFRGQVILKDWEGVNEEVLVCLEVNEVKSCKELMVRRNGTDFLVLPNPITDEAKFKAFLEVKPLKEILSKPSNQGIKLNLVPWYSPSGSYIQLESLSEEPLRCSERATFHVLYSTSEDSSVPIKFHYLDKKPGSGSICGVLSDLKPKSRVGKTHYAEDVQTATTPDAQFDYHYYFKAFTAICLPVKARGDILSKGILDRVSADSKPFEVSPEANVINRGHYGNVKQFDFNIDISAIMSPHIYLLVYFIRSDGEVVADTLHLSVERCLPNKVKTKWARNLSSPGVENSFSIEASSNSICALTVSDKSTKLISTSNDFKEENVFQAIEKYEIKSQTPETQTNRCSPDQIPPTVDEMEALLGPSDSRFLDSLQAFNDFGALVITNLNLETKPCREKGDEEILTTTNSTTRNSDVKIHGNEIENISIFNAEDFLNDTEPTLRKPSFAYELRSFFPETWIWDLINVNVSGFADLSFLTPHTLTEWTAETVCLSSTDGLGVSEPSQFITYKPFFLDFSLPHSLKKKEIFHLQVSIFNYENDDLPVKIRLYSSSGFISKSEEFRSYCIRSQSKLVHRFVLEPVRVGEAKVMIKAETDFNFTGSCGRVVSEKSDVVSKKTIIKHEGFPTEQMKSGFICGDSLHFDRKVGWNVRIPADVVESSISVEVLVSGDILGPSLKNVDHLITLPTGCGEQNMLLLVPNVLLLDYLLLTKSEELEPIEKALKNLDLGYQRQLNYKHEDGSYSAFGEQDDKGSIWLTAFVVRYLSQAKKYIYVDGKDLNSSVSWIMKHQLENGCFPMIGKIYHRSLQEKLMEEDSSKTLTAYILISLIEAGISLDNPFVKNGIYCLKRTEESLGTYGDLLSSYALILAGEYRDSQGLMIELLKEAKRSFGMLWWEDGGSIESAVEMTGYGILSLVKLGGSHFMAAASDAMRWILQYQNRNGGFVSSQDTVLALEAISKFSAKLPRTSDQDTLSVELMTLGEKHIFNISNSNRLIQQQLTLPSYVTDVSFKSSGKGCALVQTLLKYNVRRGKPNENLKIQLNIQSLSDIDLYSIAKFQICVRNKSPKEKMNMAVLEVSMVSGYYPDRSSLYEIPISRRGVRRWDEYEDKINFYFEDLRNKKVCFSFLTVREVCIENPAPALIRLYDYYNTQYETTVKYNLLAECQNYLTLDESPPPPPSSSFYKVKQESKRESKFDYDVHVERYAGGLYEGVHFEDFADVDHDLETPKGIGGPFPVFALPPNVEEEGQNCVHCLETIPNIFSKLYCSSEVAVKVLIRSSETFEFLLDVSPRRNFTFLKRPVSFTKKEECKCSILNSENNYALLLVTPPRSFSVQYVRELHLDDSIQLYPWGNPNEMPKYLIDAIAKCQNWNLGSDYID